MAGGGDLVLGADPAVSGLQPGQQLSEDGVALKIHRRRARTQLLS